MTAPLQFNLTKEGSAAPISFNLNKRLKFIIKLYWESKHDLDVHAIQLKGGKFLDAQDVLTCYNTSLVKVDNPSVNHVAGSKDAFMNINGSLKHMGDKRTGISVNAREPDEILEVDLSTIPADRDEVAFFVTDYPPNSVIFRDVNDCRLVIEDDLGAELFEAILTNDFDQYNMVKMGSIVRVNGAWEYSPNASGATGTFNDIMALHWGG